MQTCRKKLLVYLYENGPGTIYSMCVISGNMERDRMRGMAEEREAIIKLIISWPEVLHSPQDASSGELRREGGGNYCHFG